MKLKRKKLKPGSYELVDTETGKVVAEAHMTGSHLDNYPWTWYLVGTCDFGSETTASTGSTESMKSAIDLIEARAESFGLVW